MKKLIAPICAVATTTMLSAVAQEMGEVVEEQPQAALEAVQALAEAEPEVVPQTPADEGQQIVVEAQAEPPAAAAEPAVDDAPTATDIVQNMLAGLDAEGNVIPGKPRYVQGYDRKRRSIIHIGTAMAPVADPSKSSNYIQVRQMLANEAVLNAKVKIIRQIRQEISAAEAIASSDSQEADNFRRKHAEEYARLEAQRAKVQALIEDLDAAEAARLKGRTVLDDWNSLVDGIVKKLDSAYDPQKGQADKAARCAMLKDAVAEAKATLQVLEEAAKKSPIGKNTSEFKTYFDMDLFGVTTLYQAESYSADGVYEVAVASVWSPKLQDRAIRMLHGVALEPGKPGKLSLDEWLRANDANLAAMVGPRQYTDSDGIAHILGIAACEVPKNANRRQNAFEATDLGAEQAVAFALYESTKGCQSKLQEMYKYDGEDNETAKENDTLGSFAKAIQGIVSRRPVSGLSVIYTTQKIHPISGKKIYVSVASIDGSLSEVAEDLLDDMTVAKMEDIAHMDIKRARQDVREAAVEAVEASPAAYSAGVELGVESISGKMQKRTGTATSEAGPIVIETPAPRRQTPNNSRTGVFSGDVEATDDF